MTYDDGRIACTDDALVIRKYYFPFGDKRIPYSSIERARVLPMNRLSGAGRIWGSGDFIHWYNLDPGRPRKSTRLVLELRGRIPRPVITPDDPEAVKAELFSHQVTVALSAERLT